MAKKSKKNLGDIISSVTKNIVFDNDSGYIPDIIEFCESPDYLGLLAGSNPIRLYSVQKITLKVFYRGSIGNENTILTEDEIALCEELGLTSMDKGDVLGKYNSNDLFRELVLIWGRRSGKDLVISLIALYEAMKLLEVPGGNPYKYYSISSGDPISILTVAASAPQATIAFGYMKEKLLYSPYFKDKYISEGIETQRIFLLTPQDKQDNEDFRKRGLPIKKGSICIEVGHSNPDTLVGKQCIVLIADEVASYKTGSGLSSTGEKIYQLLTPMVNSFVLKTPVLDENGEEILDEHGNTVFDRQYDGKILSISSPRGKSGKLYSLYETADTAKQRLVNRLPTWEVNMQHTRQSLRDSEPSMSEQEFMMEYGAEFSGFANEEMFSRDLVEECFKNNLQLKEVGSPGKVYFAHLDPATNSHNYALVVVHKEVFLDKESRKSGYYIVVDHIKYWSPSPGKEIRIEEVDNYVIGLKRRFRLGVVSYDMWNSTASVQKLKKYGIPAIRKPFNRKYKMMIYNELANLINSHKIKIPYHNLLRNELLTLQRKFDATGFKIYPKKEGSGCKTDDVVDALAGACYMAISSIGARLPSGRVVNMDVVNQGNNVVWRSMQGIPYGVGSGQAVSKKLERRSSWPNYKR